MVIISCKPVEKTQTTIKSTSMVARPKVVIYKTKTDYYKNVPVILSSDKTKIVSYPGINDVYYKGKLAYPTLLVNGYLLDNRGINADVAFLKYSYEEYIKLSEPLTPENLFKNIIDINPVLEMYICDCTRDTAEINKIILNGFKEFCKKSQ